MARVFGPPFTHPYALAQSDAITPRCGAAVAGNPPARVVRILPSDKDGAR